MVGSEPYTATPAWELYMHEADKGLEVRFPAKAGTQVVGVSFVKDEQETEGVIQPRPEGQQGNCRVLKTARGESKP